MAVWKVQRLGRASAASGEPFPPDTEIVTALFGDDEDIAEDRVRGGAFVRRDFLVAEATEERLAGAFCSWRTRTPAAKAEPERRFDLGMAAEFLRRLLAEGREDRAPVCLTLTLLLARKRRITIVDDLVAGDVVADGVAARDSGTSEIPAGGSSETLTCRWPGEQETFQVPAPAIAEAEAETLQQDMMRLFGFEMPVEEAPVAEIPSDDAAPSKSSTPESPSTSESPSTPQSAAPEGSAAKEGGRPQEPSQGGGAAS